MSTTPQASYLESKVLTASPMELVRMLYAAAEDAVGLARQHLAEGRIAERSRAICRALDIITELSVSLDHARGGTLSASLGELYDYMQRRLLEANLQQKPEPLAEVQGLLANLRDGWEQVQHAEEPPAAGYSAVPPAVMEMGQEYTSHSWSF